MKVPYAQVNNLHPSVVAAELELLKQDIGDKDTEIVERIQQALGLLARGEGAPKIHSIEGQLNNSAAASITITGEGFLQNPFEGEEQEVALAYIWETDSSNRLALYSRIPGEGGNTKVEVTGVGGGTCVDSNIDTDPKTTIDTGANFAATETLINNNSKLIRAEVIGTPSAQAVVAEFSLAGGKGPGVQLLAGDTVLCDCREPNTKFNVSANDSFIESWSDTSIVLSIDNADHGLSAGDQQALTLRWLAPFVDLSALFSVA